MLKKSCITNIEIFSPEWFNFRLGRLTSSNIYTLINGTTGAYSYVYSKVGEELSGISIQQEYDTDGMRHGNQYEVEGLIKFGKHMGIEYMVTQKLIGDPGEKFSSTPDALIIKNQSVDGLCYNVSTVEIKCPLTYNAFVGLALCDTPGDLKSESKQYYWQVIDQMDVCDALVGYFVCYHPNFKSGKMNVIEFRKINLMEDFKILKRQKQWALDLFQATRDKLVSKLIA
jgi:hypothetical protein